jgi:hypothetical protein
LPWILLLHFLHISRIAVDPFTTLFAYKWYCRGSFWYTFCILVVLSWILLLHFLHISRIAVDPFTTLFAYKWYCRGSFWYTFCILVVLSWILLIYFLYHIPTSLIIIGWRGLYKGLGTNLVRTVPASAVTLLSYESLIRFFRRLDERYYGADSWASAAVAPTTNPEPSRDTPVSKTTADQNEMPSHSVNRESRKNGGGSWNAWGGLRYTYHHKQK